MKLQKADETRGGTYTNARYWIADTDTFAGPDGLDGDGLLHRQAVYQLVCTSVVAFPLFICQMQNGCSSWTCLLSTVKCSAKWAFMGRSLVEGGIGGRSEVMMVSYLLSFTSFALENLFRPALGYECRIYLFTLTSPTCTQKNVKYSYQKVIIK